MVKKEKFWVGKNLILKGIENIVGPKLDSKTNLFTKSVGKECFGPKEFEVGKKFIPQNYGSKKYWIQKNKLVQLSALKQFSSKQILDQSKTLGLKFFVS